MPNFKLNAIFLIIILFISCSNKNEPSSNNTEIDDTINQTINPLFPNSIVSTEIDFIRKMDEDLFESLSFIGREDKEMPDSRTDILFDTDTFIFQVNFTEGNPIEIWAHSSFITQEAAKEFVQKIVNRLGKLPDLIRNNISHIVLHKGDATAFAEAEANFFVVYSDNIDVRISNNDFEETVFHESVHATLDAIFLQNSEWILAQQNDNSFITEYAKNNSTKEDLAETALFVYTLNKFPERLPDNVRAWMNLNISNRIDFISASIFN
ncbi:hypothetical protein [uncultured Polaribacter sp.]|uniref:hypothetical protein n=1 Tax=uncultured Polaribacter sp. TaxID=174711 RepID=UPI00262206DF|nr:hypothetical protein [uncultured Polaribacter sp.]